MFCGKGGVGKTTCAAAAALHWADQAERTLIISTDFTPSLRHVFELGETDDGDKPVQVARHLFLHEISSEEVKRLWESSFGAEVYEVFSAFVGIDYPQFVDFVASILPGIRDEFMVDYIRGLSDSGTYDRIVWDTAPAGQTLGLLRMPSIVNAHLKPAPRIYSSLRTTAKTKRSVLHVLREWEGLSSRDMEFLRNDVQFNLVTIPEALAVRQLDGIVSEFERYGLHMDRMLVNQVVADADSDFLRSKAAMQQSHISELCARYPGNTVMLPMFPFELRGMAGLQEMERAMFGDGDNPEPYSA